ncbi:T9SS type A sorting domain-containing protein [candidate division KSB1 bacterium]|nr:T9SS type A sorting domain-containing protein [candidate division KSB1 bacterium]
MLVFDLSISNSNRKLRAVTHGNGVYERSLLPDPPSEVESPETMVTDFTLAQNYPNPFNPTTNITFALPVASRVTLTVFDMNGRVVTELIRNQLRTDGRHEVSFRANDLASGNYFYKLEAIPSNGSQSPFVETKTMLYLK